MVNPALQSSLVNAEILLLQFLTTRMEIDAENLKIFTFFVQVIEILIRLHSYNRAIKTLFCL